MLVKHLPIHVKKKKKVSSNSWDTFELEQKIEHLSVSLKLKLGKIDEWN